MLDRSQNGDKEASKDAVLDSTLLGRFAAIVGDKYAITDPAALEPYLIEGRGLYHGRTSMLLLL